MERLCQFNNHNKPFSLICTSPECTSNRLLCFKCLRSEHAKCLNYILEVDDVEKRTLSSNVNWIRSEDVQKATKAIRSYGVETFEVNFLKAFQDRTEREFTKVTELFLERMQQEKKKVLDHTYNRLNTEKIAAKDFDQSLSGIYSFDTLLGILGLFQSGEKNLEEASQGLSIFFAETYAEESSNKGLHAMAKRINSLNDELNQLSLDAFEKFKKCIEFQTPTPDDGQRQEDLNREKAHQGEFTQEKWTWDAKNISQEIALDTDCLIAKKTAYYSRIKATCVRKYCYDQWLLSMGN